MKWEKPDGFVEYSGSGCCCPPGQRRPGQHTNCATQWWRVNEEPWFQSHVLRQRDGMFLAEASVSCAEFMEMVNWIEGGDAR